MLRKGSRLNRDEIAEVSKLGHSLATRFFNLKFAPNTQKAFRNKARSSSSAALDSSGQAKFAFIAGKKESKNAIDRNKIKRKLRAALKAVGIPQKPLLIMVFGKKSVIQAPFSEICEAWRAILAKL